MAPRLTATSRSEHSAARHGTVNMISAVSAKGAAVRRLRVQHDRRHVHRLLQATRMHGRHQSDKQSMGPPRNPISDLDLNVTRRELRTVSAAHADAGRRFGPLTQAAATMHSFRPDHTHVCSRIARMSRWACPGKEKKEYDQTWHPLAHRRPDPRGKDRREL